MPKPSIEVLGVYSLPVTKKLVREQSGILYGSDLADDARREAESECREQLESTVLVEVIVRNRDQRFRPGDFAQRQDGVPRGDWQVAWSEAYLTEDGEELLVERGSDAPKAKTLRVAFFMHFWDRTGSLVTSYGDVTRPGVKRMPARLKKLVPYEPVD